MKKIIVTLIILIFIDLEIRCQESDKEKYRNVKIKIPNEWINKLMNYNYFRKNVQLIKEFESFFEPGLIEGYDPEYNDKFGGILNPMFVNLCNDTNTELICLIGWQEKNPILTVFKEIKNSWYLLYYEPYWDFDASNQLHVVNNYSKYKTFYIECTYDEGSGVYIGAYKFYKLINDTVYQCLELIDKTCIYGWGLYLNQEVKTNFSFANTRSDELWVSYDYNFFPGAVYEKDVSFISHPIISFVKDKKTILYKFDNITIRYMPEFNKYNELTEEKISCFKDFGNDSLFVKAFNNEINKTLEEGTDEQKKLLNQYLILMKKNHKSPVKTGELEIKKQVGGTKFYGPK